MKGIDIARAYWEQCGLPMLESVFPGLLPLVAAGLTGPGSECFGFDDDVSRDHDFEPGFCLFLPGEDQVDRRTAFRLERAYAGLPKEFMGLRRNLMAPEGGQRRGIMRTADYYREKLGTEDGILVIGQWMYIPEHTLAEAVNGVVFYDGSGEVTEIRERLSRYPEDIRRKKLTGRLLLMSQSGLYNYTRCLAHGETGAAQLAAVEFADHAMAAVFLLNEVYRPFYKWRFRAMRQLSRLSLLAELLEYLITTGNDGDTAGEKRKVMEGIAADIMGETMTQGLCHKAVSSLEACARSVNDGIADPGLRNADLLAGV